MAFTVLKVGECLAIPPHSLLITCVSANEAFVMLRWGSYPTDLSAAKLRPIVSKIGTAVDGMIESFEELKEHPVYPLWQAYLHKLISEAD